MNDIRLWDWIVLDGRRCQVVALDGATVELEDAQTLAHEIVPTTELVSQASVSEQHSAFKDLGLLARLTADQRARCEAIATALDRAQNDAANTVGQVVDHAREELAVGGLSVSERQVERYLSSYRAHGLAGLIDRRHHQTPRVSTVDQRIIDMLEAELAGQRDVSTGTRSRTIQRVRWQAERLGVRVPATATMYRLIIDLDRGRSSFGAATTRRSKALRPDRTFRGVTPTRPGELVEIDSTPLDVIALLPDGSYCRPELTYGIDVATSSICGTLLRAGATKSVDVGALLLARMLTPLSKRPGWPSTRDHARTLLGPGFLPRDEEWEEMAATMPLIVPESVTIDRGKVFTGMTFTGACERMEISQIIANPRQPTDNPHVEGGFKRIRDGFVRYLAGFTGGTVSDRGAHPESDAVWTVEELQILLDLWVLTSWQNTPQSGLRLPDIPRRTLSPNQMYQALSAAAPQVPVGLTDDDYIQLMPLAWRTIQPYGINLHGLTYDADALHPLRGRRSGLAGVAKGRWEIRFDPYNLRNIWVHDHRNDRWINAPWTLSMLNGQPFSREVLRVARASVGPETSPQPSRGLELLEQISRIQDERSATRKKTRTTRSASNTSRSPSFSPEPILRIVPALDDDENAVSEPNVSSARLKILE